MLGVGVGIGLEPLRSQPRLCFVPATLAPLLLAAQPRLRSPHARRQRLLLLEARRHLVLGVGVGVGVALGLLLLEARRHLRLRRRRLRRLAKARLLAQPRLVEVRDRD